MDILKLSTERPKYILQTHSVNGTYFKFGDLKALEKRKSQEVLPFRHKHVK
jgi:hypothetical protein